MTLLSRAHDALHLQANAQGALAALQRSLLGGYMPARDVTARFYIAQAMTTVADELQRGPSAGHANRGLSQRCRFRLGV